MGPYKELIKALQKPCEEAVALAAVPDLILFIIQCSDWPASSEWYLGTSSSGDPNKSLAKQKGNYGMGLLP